MGKQMFKKEEQLGEYGSASVAIDSMAVVTAQVAVKVDIIAELEKAAALTDTKVDDTVVLYIKNLLAAANAVAQVGS